MTKLCNNTKGNNKCQLPENHPGDKCMTDRVPGYGFKRAWLTAKSYENLRKT